MRIVIVEDEIKIREGMGKLIASQTGHIVLGEASDGVEGLEMILRFKPDLVITDIRMPRMDGLEMIRELHSRRIGVHVIILSGYSEFEYAQKAIQYGVDDYLLKPLAADDVQEMLDKIEERIKKEQLTNGTEELYLRNLLFGEEKNQDKNREILKDICGFPENGTYVLFAGYIGCAAASYREEMEQKLEELKEKYQSLKLYSIYQENLQKEYVLAYGAESKAGFQALEKSFYNRMILQYQHKPERAVWTRQEFEGLDQLRETAGRLERRLAYALVLEPEGWLDEEQCSRYQTQPFTAPVELYNRIRNAICQGDTDGLKKGAGDFLKYMEEGHFEMEDIRRAFVKNYYFIGDTLQEIDQVLYSQLRNGNLLRNIQSAMTWRELEYAYRDVLQVLTGSKAKREDISNYIIKRAINYIRENYQKGLTLEEVAQVLDITPEYLSTLFNREMGINFSAFLKRFRMSHAKRLLKGSELKIYEIAGEIGYSDPKYFQRVFKEEVGVSPGEYRQMK